MSHAFPYLCFCSYEFHRFQVILAQLNLSVNRHEKILLEEVGKLGLFYRGGGIHRACAAGATLEQEGTESSGVGTGIGRYVG